MKKRFTEEQIIGFLREAEAGMPVAELCRKHAFSEASYYLWRSKFGGMSVSDAKRLKELEAENTRLKKLLAESLLENEIANQVFRLAVISQQAIQQLLGYCFLSYGHHRSWQCGSFLPGDRLHKNSYTLVSSTQQKHYRCCR